MLDARFQLLQNTPTRICLFVNYIASELFRVCVRSRVIFAMQFAVCFYFFMKLCLDINETSASQVAFQLVTLHGNSSLKTRWCAKLFSLVDLSHFKFHEIPSGTNKYEWRRQLVGSHVNLHHECAWESFLSSWFFGKNLSSPTMDIKFMLVTKDLEFIIRSWQLFDVTRFFNFSLQSNRNSLLNLR